MTQSFMMWTPAQAQAIVDNASSQTYVSGMGKGGYPDGVSSGTDSDTSSDSGMEEISLFEGQNVPQDQLVNKIWWGMRTHKRAWRRITNKPVRRLRRFVKRRGGKGGGKSRHFLATEAFRAYLRRKGKGGKSSSGKGFGRGSVGS